MQKIVIILLFQFSQHVCSVSNYGEICEYSDECSDHRYICKPDNKNTSRCQCDQFHKWLGFKFGCIQIFNSTEIVNKTVKIKDNIAILEKERDAKFQVQAAAGIFVLAVLLLGALSISIFCMYMSYSDSDLAESIKPKQATPRQNTSGATSTTMF